MTNNENEILEDGMLVEREKEKVHEFVRHYAGKDPLKETGEGFINTYFLSHIKVIDKIRKKYPNSDVIENTFIGLMHDIELNMPDIHKYVLANLDKGVKYV